MTMLREPPVHLADIAEYRLEHARFGGNRSTSSGTLPGTERYSDRWCPQEMLRNAGRMLANRDDPDSTI